MKRDLRQLSREQKVQPSAKAGAAAPEALSNQIPEGMKQEDFRSIQSAVERYGTKSDDELMGELKTFKSRGDIDDARLADVAARLAPLLNDEQRKRLQSVLGDLSRP